jgi:lysophospholipase L1-like esterase
MRGDSSRFELAYRATTGALGTGVLVVLLTALLLLIGEGLARLLTGEGAVRTEGRVVTSFDVAIPDLVSSEVFRDYPWIKEFEAERSRNTGGGLQYEPFVLWRHGPARSRFVNFDERGFRVTINPAKPGATREVRVLVLGGSTVAGDGYVRDEDTIASRLSARLNQAFPALRVVVTNAGQSGYGQDNEIAMMVKLLREGERPDLVVFCDGPNDVSHLVTAEVPHMAYRAYRSAIESPLRRVFLGALRRSVLLRLALGLEAPVEYGLQTDPQRLRGNITPMLRHYLGNVEVIQALARGFGFQVLVAWQPTLFTTTKPLGPSEAALLRRVDAEYPFIGLAYRETYAAFRAALAGRASAAVVVNHGSAPSGVARSIFADVAHLSPAGYDALAAVLVEEIQRRGLIAG